MIGNHLGSKWLTRIEPSVVLGPDQGYRWKKTAEPTDEQKEAMSPRWIAPVITWLASTESRDITGRVIESSGSVLAVAEGEDERARRQPMAIPRAGSEAGRLHREVPA